MDNIEQKLKEGNSTAINYLYNKSYSQILNLVLSNNGFESDAKDLFQDAIMSLIHNIRKGSYSPKAEISTYLYSIARNQWLNILKKKNKIQLTDNISEDNVLTYSLSNEEFEKSNLKEERIQLILQKLESLGSECQELLKSFYFKRMKQTEIAKAMNYTDQFIRVKKSRCMNELKKLVIA